jgi:hypothetical protein
MGEQNRLGDLLKCGRALSLPFSCRVVFRPLVHRGIRFSEPVLAGLSLSHLDMDKVCVPSVATYRFDIVFRTRVRLASCKVLAVYTLQVVRDSSVGSTVLHVHRRGPVRPNIHVPNTEVKSELPRARARSWSAAVRRLYMDPMVFVWLCSLQDDIGIRRTILVYLCADAHVLYGFLVVFSDIDSVLSSLWLSERALCYIQLADSLQGELGLGFVCGGYMYKMGIFWFVRLPYLDVTHSFLPRTSERTHAHVFSPSVPRLILFLEREDVEPCIRLRFWNDSIDGNGLCPD